MLAVDLWGCRGEREGTRIGSTRWRRHIFRRIFYREDPFDLLEPADLSGIFDAYSCVVRAYPVVLHWVHALNDREFLVLAFQHRSMARYEGLEFVHITVDRIGYHRLPGAQKGGRGKVNPGVHAVSIQSPGEAKHHLRIQKNRFGRLRLVEICAPAVDAMRFAELQWHVLDPSKFADEMRITVERAVEWSYQRSLVGEHDAAWTVDVAAKCAGVSARTDSLLAEVARQSRGER